MLSWNSQWKYADSGTNLGTIWRTNDYSDADAPWRGPAPGLFGFEPDSPEVYAPYGGIPTPLAQYVSYPDGNTLNQVTNYYFRATFDWAGEPATNYYLVASNVVDDGVAVFLNGMPLYTLRVAGNATATTLATGVLSTEGTNEVLSFLPATWLRPGANLVAAELHQQHPTSSDAVFGMTLAAVPYVPLTITRQPANLSLSAGENATLDVGVSGTSPWCQWYKVSAEGVTNLFLQGSGKTNLPFSNISATSAGLYFVVITNAISSVASSSAAITVRVDPLRITEQPRNVDTLPATRTNFTVGVIGSQPAYKWFKITEVTNALGRYFTTNAASSQNTNAFWFTASTGNVGWYYCVITNSLGAITSRVARLRLIQDYFGPLLRSATVELEQTDMVRITFNENLLSDKDSLSPAYDFSAWNALNYTVTTVGSSGRLTGVVPVLEVIDVSATNVYLRLETQLNLQTNCMLTANRVADRKTNCIAPNSWTPILCERTNTIIPFGSAGWRWNELVASQNEFDAYVTTNWTKVDYNDDPALPPYAWSEGTALFWADPAGIPANLNITNAGVAVTAGQPVYYFRKTFTWCTDGASETTATLNHLIDDGAVFYLNGEVIGRANIASGTVTWRWPAYSPIEPVYGSTPSVSVDSMLRNGTNVLAVEVHQTASLEPQPDVFFDAALTLTWFQAPALALEPATNVRLLGDFDLTNQVVRLFWTNQVHNLAIVGAENLEDPIWYPMQPASTNMVFPLTNQMRFFQLREFK